MCTRPFDQKLGSSLIYFFFLHTTIRPNYMVLFHLFFLQCTTVRSKIRVLINLFSILVHDHSTKVRGHSYSLIYYFLNSANISFAIFMADTAFIIFRALCFKQYCFYISYANSYQYYPYTFRTLYSVCNFQFMKSPVELNSLLSNFFCYITWFVLSPDQT